MNLHVGQTATRQLTLTDEHVRKYAEIRLRAVDPALLGIPDVAVRRPTR